MSIHATLTAMQEQLAFQEQMLDALNTSFGQQQLELSRLQHRVTLLTQQLKDTA